MFDISRYYRIWFSANPESFLGMDDQLRFIEFRNHNPEANIAFIYSSHCLSKNSQNNLDKFCNTFNIIPVDFDAIVKDLENVYDLKMYALAKEEIAKALSKTGGNLAAAADCARLIGKIIEKYGIYSDHDVGIHLSKLQTEFLSLQGPLLFSAEEFPTTNNSVILTNSDFLALSVNQQDPSRLSDTSLKAVRNLQETIIQHYESPFCWEIISPSLKIKQLVKYPELEALLQDFHSRYESPNIFDFRIYLSQLPDQPALKQQDESLKIFLTKLSVINISGPGTYPYLFKHLLPKGCTHFPATIPLQDVLWAPFMQTYRCSDIAFYTQIENLVTHHNTLKQAMINRLSGITKPLADHSWLETGKLAKQNHETKMLEAATLVQDAWRRQLFWKKHCVDASLFMDIKKICKHELILEPVIKKNYEVALRRACAGLKLSVVKILLEYKDKKALEININKPSDTEQKTALDWVTTAKTRNNQALAQQKLIIELLIKAGALTFDELESSSLITQPK